MTSKRPPISLERRLLGGELLRLRETAKLNQAQAAEVLGKAQNKISRVESGLVGIDKTDLEVLLTRYGASEKDKVWCRHLAAQIRRRRRPDSETTLYLGPTWFRAFRDLELSASEIMENRSEIITGLLQTESYIRAMFAAQGFDPADQLIEDTVRTRAERRLLLSREDAPRFSFVLSESALRRQIGSPEVMAEQLRYLAEVALLPNISLQVIPFDSQSHDSLHYDFTIFRFAHDAANDIVYIEMYDDAAYLTKPEERVREYSELFGRLQRIALGPIESRNFILGLADQFAAT